MYWVIPYLIHKTPYPYQINIYSLAHKIWEGEKISLYACLNSRQNNPPESNGTPMIICWVSHSWDFHLIKCVATNDQTDYSPYWVFQIPLQVHTFKVRSLNKSFTWPELELICKKANTKIFRSSPVFIFFLPSFLSIFLLSCKWGWY